MNLRSLDLESDALPINPPRHLAVFFIIISRLKKSTTSFDMLMTVMHVQTALSLLKVVPTALLAALLKGPVREAQSALRQQPVLRQVILDTLSGQHAHAQ